MKKIKKSLIPIFLMLIFLMLIFFITSIGTEKVYAIDRPTGEPVWDFKIVGIGDAKRQYFNDNTFNFSPMNMKIVNDSGETYNINTKEVAIQTGFINHYDHSYVYVDERYVGEDDVNLIDLGQTGDINLKTFVIKHLTPGKHKIKLITNPPYSPGSLEQKQDYLYVNIPVFEDEKIQEAINNICKGNATLNDYEVIGIDTTKINDLKLLNEKVKGKELNASNVQATIADILNQITVELNAKTVLEKINAGTATLDDYKTVEVSGVNSDNLGQVNAMIKITRESKGSDLTKDEIEQLIVDLPNKIKNSFAKINEGTATLGDYTLVGAINVTEINLVDINEGVKGKDNSTVSKLQSNINVISSALSNINQGSKVLSFYTKLGITTVTSDNIKLISENMVAAKKAKGNNLTKAEIKKVVEDSLKSIEDSFAKINEGTAALDDYTLVGAIKVTEINLVDINEGVKGKDNSTVSKLQNNINIIAEALSNINQGLKSINYYTVLGITTVKSDNIRLISQNILDAKKAKGNNLTKAEIKKVVEDSLKSIEDSFAKINEGTAALDDYTLVGAIKVTEINLVDINEGVKGKDNSTVSKLQNNINIIAEALSNINQGLKSINYYTVLGITTVKSDNIKLISKNVVAAKKAKGSNLTKSEIKKVVEDSLK